MGLWDDWAWRWGLMLMERRAFGALRSRISGAGGSSRDARTSATVVERHRGRRPYKFSAAGCWTSERSSATPAEGP